MSIGLKENGKEIAKVGSSEEAMWTELATKIKLDIEGMEKQIKISKEFLIVAEKKAKETALK